ncbi:MAG: alpha/beta hydrolase [Bacteroidota bacterium]
MKTLYVSLVLIALLSIQACRPTLYMEDVQGYTVEEADRPFPLTEGSWSSPEGNWSYVHTGVDTQVHVYLLPDLSNTPYHYQYLLNDTLLGWNTSLFALGHDPLFKGRSMAEKSLALNQMLSPQLEDKPMILMGIGWGATLAAKMALDHPGKFRKLILVNGYYEALDEAATKQIRRRLKQPRLWIFRRKKRAYLRTLLSYHQELRELQAQWHDLQAQILVISSDQVAGSREGVAYLQAQLDPRRMQAEAGELKIRAQHKAFIRTGFTYSQLIWEMLGRYASWGKEIERP